MSDPRTAETDPPPAAPGDGLEILPNTPPPDPPPPPPGAVPLDPGGEPEAAPETQAKPRRPMRSSPDGWDQHDAVTIRDSAVRALAPLRQGPASPVGHHAGFGPAGFGTVLI